MLVPLHKMTNCLGTEKKELKFKIRNTKPNQKYRPVIQLCN
jgi:hypothetical protein